MTAMPNQGPRELGLMHRLYKPTIFRAIAEALPPGLHPNVITLVGQVCAVLAALAAYWAARGVTALYPACALLHFVYLASDNVDGMHARRTGQTSLTGELLDHGLDGIAILCLSLTAGFILRVDGPFLVTFAALPTLAFLLAHWEHQQTGEFGPVTGQADGYTLGVVLALVAFAFDNPPWLAFSFGRFNAALVIVVLLFPASLVAVVGPSLRAWKTGARFGEVGLACVLLVALHAYALLGAPAWCVGATAGVVATDLGVRAVHARIAGRKEALLAPRHGLVVVPVLGCLALPENSNPAIWAAIAAGLALICLVITWSRALPELRRLDAARAFDAQSLNGSAASASNRFGVG
jgi:phosphatidylglycerophosphate synthase